MSRLSIELTQAQHKKIKAIAALSGSSIKEYVLERILPSSSDEKIALDELEGFLSKRIDAAKSGDVVLGSAREIFRNTLT